MCKLIIYKDVFVEVKLWIYCFKKQLVNIISEEVIINYFVEKDENSYIVDFQVIM